MNHYKFTPIPFSQIDIKEQIVRDLSLSEEQQSKISLYDFESGLYLLHYNNFIDEDVYDFRGMIYDSKSRKVICRSLPFVLETTVDKINMSSLNFDNLTVSFLKEGTVIRLYYQDEWKISTHKRINAEHANWGNSPSFKQLFLDLFNKDKFNLLDKSKCYNFLLIHKSVEMIMKIQNNELYFISVFANEKHDFDEFNRLKKHFRIFNTVKVNKKRTLNKQFKTIMNSNDYYAVIVSDGNQYFKILNNQFVRVKQYRNNIPTIQLSFLYCLINKLAYEKTGLLDYYSEQRFQLESLENNFYNLIHDLGTIFNRRYVCKEYVKVPRLMNIFLGKLKTKFMSQSQFNISIEIQSLLLDFTLLFVLNLINEYESWN